MFLDFCNDQDGATAVEYGLLIGIISAGLIGVFKYWNITVFNMYDRIIVAYENS